MKKNYAATTDISYHEGSGETYETVACQLPLAKAKGLII